jgi:hypothetical protein
MTLRNPSPVGAVVRGAVAGAVGTAAMDLLLFSRYKRGGGKDAFTSWEFSAGIDSWDDAPAPAQVGRRLVEGLFQRPLPDRRAKLVNNITHWGYGTSAGVPYGILVGSLRTPRVGFGPLFGAGVWASSYVVLPAAGLYKPIQEYDRTTLAKDLSAHLLYGLCTAAAFRLTLRRGTAR